MCFVRSGPLTFEAVLLRDLKTYVAISLGSSLLLKFLLQKCFLARTRSVSLIYKLGLKAAIHVR